MFKVNTDHKLAKEEVDKLDRRLSVMCSKLGFHCSQVNGQRVCTSIRYTQKPDVKGTEIFIGKIPRKIFEDELIPLFLRAGELFQFRLMLDFSLKNRGFAFATYVTVDGAERAITLFDNFEIGRNNRIGVFKSVDNCRLFFGNIPQVYTKADIAGILKNNLINGISDIIMYKNLVVPAWNRGYVFVEFETHRDAAMAKKQLYPGCLVVEGQSVFVDWADPIPDVDSKIMAKVTKLFIHHLPLAMSKEELSETISQYVDMKAVLKVHKQLNYAFVHFHSRESAERAKRALNDLPFPDVLIEWARPRQYSKQQRLESPPTHFCLSLPPKMRRHYQQFINSLICETSSNESQKSSSNDSPTRSLKDKPESQMKRALPQSDNALLQTCKPMGQIDQNSGNLQFSPEDEIIRTIGSIRMHQSSMTDQGNNGFSRAPTQNILSTTYQTTTRVEEPPNRNPLIGLPINLIPTRQKATPPPMVISERTDYNDLMYQNSCRNPFYNPFFYNNTMFTPREPRYPQQAGAPMITSGGSTPLVQNHTLPSGFNQFF